MKIYRHEIDGMRALAVISVIFFHAQLPFISGGYAGVDIFFVISGYLITSIILFEHDNNTFSLVQFYERRARRILPALFLVMFICVPFAIYSMLPNQLQDFAEELVAVTLGLSNVCFWKKENYFNSNTELNPIVHTWSLAIEEQFYVLFAPLFVIFSKYQHRFIMNIIIVVTLVSLIFAQWSGNLQLAPPFITKDLLWFAQRDWASFYLLTGRAWELLFGSLSAFYLHHHTSKMLLWKQIGAAIGLALVLFSIFYMDATTPFPSFYTLVPTIGTVLLIIYGDQETYVGRLLSIRILKTIGLCSYSAYLWHQPLFAFAKLNLNEKQLAIGIKIGFILLSFFLAYLTWRQVETPFRDKKKYSRQQIFVSALIAALILDAFSMGILVRRASEHENQRRINPLLYNVSKKQESFDNSYLLDLHPYKHFGYVNDRFYPLLNVSFNKNDTQRKKLAIIGDSHARDFLNMAAENDKLKNYQIRTYDINHYCQMYIGPEDRLKFIHSQFHADCNKNYRLIDALPLMQESDVIILVSRWQLWAAQRINGTVEALKLRPTQTLIVVGSKVFSKKPPKAYMDTSYEYRMSLRYTIPPDEVLINTILMNNLNPKITVDIEKLVCGANYSCPVFTAENRLVSPDDNHLTKSGAKYVGDIIFKEPPLRDL